MRDRFEARREVRLDESVAWLEAAAVGPQKDLGGDWIHAEPLAVEDVGVGPPQHKAVARQSDRRCQQCRARETAVFCRRALEPHHRAGHSGRAVAPAAELVDRLAGGVEIHRGGRRPGCGLAEIDEGVAPVLQVDGHEPAAADIAAARIDDGERIADGNRGIDRVAALGEDAHADLGGIALRGDHHAVLGLDRRRGQRREQDQREYQPHPDHPWFLPASREKPGRKIAVGRGPAPKRIIDQLLASRCRRRNTG